MKHIVIRRCIIFVFIVLFACAPTVSAIAQTTNTLEPKALVSKTQKQQQIKKLDNKRTTASYSQLMRRAADTRKDEEKQDNAELGNDLAEFIVEEKGRLHKLGVSKKKQRAYIKLLQDQRTKIDKDALSWFDKRVTKVKEWLVPKESDLGGKKNTKKLQVDIPKKPASFRFSNPSTRIQTMRNPRIRVEPGQKVWDSLKNIAIIDTVNAYDDVYMPELADVQDDGEEIIISPEMQELVKNLQNNPVDIVNFVRSNVVYEPYFGAKKGSLGCFEERVCNDVDTSSLTIALLRAAGIPATYKKAVAVMPVEQLQNLLGVEETKTVYAAFAANDVPVFTLNGAGGINEPLNGDLLDNADLSGVAELALEWVFVEMFYSYDEHGTNISNNIHTKSAQSTQELRDMLRDSQKRQWIPVDATVHANIYTQQEIVPETANIDTEAFWYDYLQYQGNLGPIEKYTQDILAQTGKDIQSQQYHSFVEREGKTVNMLPYVLPYLIGEGESGQGENILIEEWSVLPDEKRKQVTVSLRDKDTNEVVISHTIFSSQINNVPLSVLYEGATDVDKAVIIDHGGMYATPASLVDITPYFLLGSKKLTTENTIEIGQSLVLQFDYGMNNNISYTDQKFSTAGNTEGVFISLSRIKEDAVLDNTQDPKREAKILLEGNSAIAREYLKRLQDNADLLEKVFDYQSNIHFTRAVVTQNRILNNVNGTPTTFDFSGLSIDATVYIHDQSRRGNYKDRRKDFRLLWGLDASYYEAQLFADIAGLEGISTVNGLQYAYANPNQYTVHTITSQNAGVIDGLNLSENTKQNMHADVQEGNTIITPDGFVEDGEWRGILYISLDDDWTGTYAIGEQVQNGGWTKDGFEIITVLRNGEEIARFINQGETNNFIFADDAFGNNKKCRISRQTFIEIMGAEGWDDSYGLPCYRGDADFTDIEHSVILATEAAKFYSPNAYNYWIEESAINTAFNNYIQTKKNLDESHLNYLEDGAIYSKKFSSILGTYIYNICENDGFFNCGDYATAYYTPNNAGGSIYRARADILSKLAEANNGVIRVLGFPTSDELYAADSEGISDGRYQNFVNGQMYEYEYYLITRAHYVYGAIEGEYNNNGGSSGELGFPLKDPQVGLNGLIFQSFEGGKEIKWDTTSNELTIINFRRYRCEIFGDIASISALRFMLYHGFADSVIDVIKGIPAAAELLVKMYNFTSGFPFLLPDPYKIYQVMADIPIEDIILMAENLQNEILDALVVELNENNCKARKSYVTGKIIGNILLIYVPVDELARIGTLSKLKTFSQIVTKTSKGVSALQKYKNSSKLWKSIFLTNNKVNRYNVFDSWIEKSLADSRWKPNAHHIIPQNFRNSNVDAHNRLIDRLDEMWGGPGKFNLNDELNGVILPQKLHLGAHSKTDYMDPIANKLNRRINEGASKNEIIQEINILRNEILDGGFKINKNWAPENQDLIDAVKNTKHIYE